jgi:hypothetical protein
MTTGWSGFGHGKGKDCTALPVLEESEKSHSTTGLHSQKDSRRFACSSSELEWAEHIASGILVADNTGYRENRVSGQRGVNGSLHSAALIAGSENGNDGWS